jgi:hypothetical protein
VEGSSEEVLITKHALIEGSTYLDPRSKRSFVFDHLRKACRLPSYLQRTAVVCLMT